MNGRNGSAEKVREGDKVKREQDTTELTMRPTTYCIHDVIDPVQSWNTRGYPYLQYDCHTLDRKPTIASFG